MKKHSNAESAIRTHQLESVPCVVIRLEIVPLINTPKTVPNGVPTPPLNSVPPITEAEIASISRPLACSTNPEQLFKQKRNPPHPASSPSRTTIKISIAMITVGYMYAGINFPRRLYDPIGR